jgi:hypothetical protein
MYHYQIIGKYTDHHNHPMEIEAENMAKKDRLECISYLEDLYKTTDNKKLILKEETDIYSHTKPLIPEDDFSPINT